MKLSFVELAVGDWPAAVAWYHDVLGLEVLHTDETSRFALLAAGAARLALKAGEAVPGGVLLAFEVEGLDGWVERLRRAGVAPDGEVKSSPEGYRRLKVRDPEGHAVTLFEWR